MPRYSKETLIPGVPLPLVLGHASSCPGLSNPPSLTLSRRKAPHLPQWLPTLFSVVFMPHTSPPPPPAGPPRRECEVVDGLAIF